MEANTSEKPITYIRAEELDLPASSKKSPKKLISIILGVFIIALLTGVLLGFFLFGQSRDVSMGKKSSSKKTQAAALSTSGSTASPVQTDVLDIHALPLGDGKVASSPKVGYVFSCQTNFGGGGSQHAGDWIQGSTWDMTKKISVLGSLSWPNAKFSTSINGLGRMLSGNGLPVDTTTGVFPVQRDDPAFQYDRNPNSIKSYAVSFQIPKDPQFAVSSSCVPMGAIGYALNGVAIYNALDAAGRDAVAHEVQDSCDGHPQGAGQYHYHGPSNCMPHVKENNALVGYALDGFGIYSEYDANGKEYTNSDLDACHGITSQIEWDGKMVTMYHYVLTREYPYTIGCFRGTPVLSRPAAGQNSGSDLGSGNFNGNPPPPPSDQESGNTTFPPPPSL